MSLKRESIKDLVDLKRVNRKVIAAIRAANQGNDRQGKWLIKEYEEGIREIEAELARRKTDTTITNVRVDT